MHCPEYHRSVVSLAIDHNADRTRLPKRVASHRWHTIALSCVVTFPGRSSTIPLERMFLPAGNSKREAAPCRFWQFVRRESCRRGERRRSSTINIKDLAVTYDLKDAAGMVNSLGCG